MEKIFNEAFMSCREARDTGKNTTTQETDIFAAFALPTSEIPDCLPSDLVPCRHQVPAWNDPTVQPPDWNIVFGTDLELTSPRGGIRTQKVNQNLTEIAEAICRRYEFAAISGRLAVYQPPCWKIMERIEALHFVTATAQKLFPADSKFVSDHQYSEILFQIMHHQDTELLRKIPAPDSRYLCCSDCMFDWRTGERFPHRSSYKRF